MSMPDYERQQGFERKKKKYKSYKKGYERRFRKRKLEEKK